LKRLIEGIRIHRANPGSKLVLSGGTWLDPVPNANVLADTARLIAVNEGAILTESESRDTEDEARLIKAIVATNEFILVTSATHMARSIRLFERRGTKPIPAPAEHLVKPRRLGAGTLFPSGGNLRRKERAIYEYLGIAWAIVKSGCILCVLTGTSSGCPLFAPFCGKE
jgi:uncharacterized SAM-binding protein YcdF (DUF218 family)